MSKTYVRRNTKLDTAEVIASMRQGQTYTIKELAEMHKISPASMQIVVGLIEVAGKVEACASVDGKRFRLKAEQPKFVTAKPLDLKKMYAPVSDRVADARRIKSFMPIIEGNKPCK